MMAWLADGLVDWLVSWLTFDAQSTKRVVTVVRAKQESSDYKCKSDSLKFLSDGPP